MHVTMRATLLCVLFLTFLACTPQEPSLIGTWRHTETGHTLTFEDDVVTISNADTNMHGGMTIKSPYERTPTHFTFLEYPYLMKGIRMPYAFVEGKLVLDPGGMTEKVYERVQ